MKKLLFFLLGIVLSISLVACGTTSDNPDDQVSGINTGTQTSDQDECEHEFSAATCTTPKTCKKCGETSGDVAEHVWSAATCTTPKTCTVCGKTTGSVADHTWKDATCTEPKECSGCGITSGNALGHKWNEATCSTPKTCAGCGMMVGGVLVHNWNDASCTDSRECDKCGKTLGNAEFHTEGAWIVDKQATCTEAGSRHKECTVCGTTTITETLDALGHKFGDLIIDNPATCTKTGTGHRVCSVCKGTVAETVALLAHTDSDLSVDKEATCTTAGSGHKVCVVCNANTGTQVIDALGHDHKLDRMENSGIVGSKLIYKCTACSDTYDEVVKPLVASVQLVNAVSAASDKVGSFSSQYKVSVSGGYGKYQYKYECFANASATTPDAKFTADFSGNNTYWIRYIGTESQLDDYILRVTIKDEAGNQTVVNYELKR